MCYIVQEGNVLQPHLPVQCDCSPSPSFPSPLLSFYPPLPSSPPSPPFPFLPLPLPLSFLLFSSLFFLFSYSLPFFLYLLPPPLLSFFFLLYFFVQCLP